MRIRFTALVCLLFVFAACKKSIDIPAGVSAAGANLPAMMDYNQHIKPILSDRCFKCHGPDKNKIEAKLQLASYEGATQKAESGLPAIIPNKAAASELVKRILSDDPEAVMPPPESHLTLSNEEKAMIIQWINDGAEYKKHWSLTKIRQPAVPKVGQSWFARMGFTDDEETNWVANEIDHFTLDKMKTKGMKPSKPADKTKLLRRVHMDLTGLPPSPEDVNDFLNDKSDNAYEKIVDKLLNSPHFGEQQAVSWLDLARYADSHGYQDDGMRNAFPYRDWVIKSFNDNLSFDQFITQQLAGDLLPKPTRDMMVATSFNRQHPQSQEGGIVPEEYLVEYVADRTNTFGKAFLGLTMECARCHDHKYDPISAKDYYSLFAFFNQNKEYGEVPYNGEAAPTVMLPTKEVEEKIRYIRENLMTSSYDLDPNADVYKSSFDSYYEKIKSIPDEKILNRDLMVHVDFDKTDKDGYINLIGNTVKVFNVGDKDRQPILVKGKFENAVQFRGDCGIDLKIPQDKKDKKNNASKNIYEGLNFERNQPFSVSAWFNILKEGITGPLLTKNNSEFEGYRGYDITLNADATLTVRMMYVYPTNGIEFRTIEKLPLNQWTNITLTYDGSSRAKGLKLFLNGKEASTNLLTDNLTKSILHGEGGTNKSSIMPFQIGKNFRETIDSVAIDELRIYKRRLATLEVEALYENKKSIALTDKNQKSLEFYVWNYNDQFAQALQKATAIRLEETRMITNVPEVMVMQELPPDQKRKTHILSRGVYDSPGEEVTAETPLKLGKLPAHYPRNRLGLTQWLLDENNPLFARVMANRFWLQFFGNGLVKTQEDFGNQGDLPSHPELLDWLAFQFREDRWNTKTFIRRLVTSATYCQSSFASPEMIEKDPENKWLARGSSYQFSAEQIRDNALAASGLLVRKIGGPSVYPYQPSGIWEALATRNAASYKQQHGDSLYRRSMYTIWKRSSPPPMMLNFDAPDRQLCMVRRQRTVTPLQALVSLNDLQFVEAARVLAEHTIKAKSTEKDRIQQMFLSALSREARPAEMNVMLELLQTQIVHYQMQPEQATEILGIGEYPLSKSANPVLLAAYTVVANTVLNYDEALVKR